MMKIKKIVSMLLSALMLLSLFTVNVMAENTSEDIRYDFFTDAKDVVNFDGGQGVVDGAYVLYINSESGKQDQVFATLQANLGEGGWYAYVKFKSENNNTDQGSLAGTQGAYVGVSDNATSGFTYIDYDKETAGNFKMQYGVVKFDLSGQSGEKFLRFHFKQKGGTVGDAYIYIDWIVLSKSETAPAEPEEPTVASDFRFDFTSGLQGVDKAGGTLSSGSIAPIDGNCLIKTAENAELSSKNLQLALPSVNLGDGGYYMYAKVKYTLPATDKQKFNSVHFAHSTDGKSFTEEKSDNLITEWSDYAILKYDISELSKDQFLKLYFKTRQTEPNGLATISFDWIVITKSATAPTEAYLSLDSKFEFDGITWSATVYGEMEHAAITQDARVYFAGYNDAGNSKTLEAVNLTDITFVGSADSKNETINITEKLTIEDPDIKYVKVFVWDLNYAPLCNAMIPKE